MSDSPQETPAGALNYARQYPIQIPQWNRTTLIIKACHHHNQREKQRAARLDDLYAEIQLLNPHAPEKRLAQACVNFLRWRCEQADPRVLSWQGRASYFEAQCQSKSRILEAIAAQYPWLQAEAQAQNPLR